MSEYINMASRNWSYAGDKGTWVRRNDDGTYTVKKALRGIMTDAYTAELREFCAQYGQDFDAIRCGESITFPKAEPAKEQAEAQPAEETKPEEKPAPAPAPVKEWRKFAVNVQDITDTSKACKIAFPHSSKLDGYIIWVPAKLVRGGSHSYEATVSMHKDMTFRAIKYGQGDNWRDVIDEREVSQEEILEAFGGEVSGKFGPKQDVEEVITHTPAPLAPVHTEAAPELVR